MTEYNSLISLISSGKVKTKGAYEFADYTKLGWHKNHSALVIPTSVVGHLLNLWDYEEFILLHENKWDFMCRTKVPRSSKLVLVMPDGEEIDQQNICRYYPSKEGGNLIKIMPPLEEGGEWRRLGIDVEWSVKTCNDIRDFTRNDLNFEYYLQEAKKLIEGVA